MLSAERRGGTTLVYTKKKGPRTHSHCASMEAGTLLYQRSLASLIVTESVTVFKNRIYHCIGERQLGPTERRADQGHMVATSPWKQVCYFFKGH